MKKVTHYFLSLERTLVTKNKLQHELLLLIKSMHGMLIEVSSLATFKLKFETEVEKLNNKYPRMKSIHVSYSVRESNGKIIVETIEALPFYLESCELVDFNEIEYQTKNN